MEGQSSEDAGTQELGDTGTWEPWHVGTLKCGKSVDLCTA